MYHRIGDLKTDPWQLAVSPENFNSQIKIIKENFKTLSINELVKQLNKNVIDTDSICITFDDAYIDNYLVAKPILEKFECAATFFIPTSFIGQQQQFWWDELETILLHQYRLPKKIELTFNGQKFEFSLENETLTDRDRQDHQLWIWPNTPPTERCELYLKIWERLRPLLYEHIAYYMSEIRKWAGYEFGGSPDNFPMDSSQIKELSDHPLFSLGVHTQTHPALTSHPLEIQRSEIANCKTYLQQHYEKKVDAIAYPYGIYNDLTLSVVKEEQISAGFTTKGEVITARSHPLFLGRFQAKNIDGAEFKDQLYEWLDSKR